MRPFNCVRSLDLSVNFSTFGKTKLVLEGEKKHQMLINAQDMPIIPVTPGYVDTKTIAISNS